MNKKGAEKKNVRVAKQPLWFNLVNGEFILFSPHFFCYFIMTHVSSTTGILISIPVEDSCKLNSLKKNINFAFFLAKRNKINSLFLIFFFLNLVFSDLFFSLPGRVRRLRGQKWRQCVLRLVLLWCSKWHMMHNRWERVKMYRELR